MRTATAPQIAALEALHKQTRIYLEAWNGSTWIDLTAYQGDNWLRSASWGETTDRTVIRANLSLRREVGDVSLAPLVQDPPLLERTARMRLAAEVNELDGADTGRVELLAGRINKSDWGGDRPELSVSFRDEVMGEIRHAAIDEPFAIPGGTLSQSLAAVLDEFAPSLTITAVQDPPGTFPAGYQVPAGTVLDGLYHLVDQTGWELRRRWLGSEFGLELFEPQDPTDETPTPVLTLDPIDYFEIPSAGLTSAEVRDRIRVTGLIDGGDTAYTATAQTPTPLFGPNYRTEPFDVSGYPLLATAAAINAFAAKALLTLGRVPAGYRVRIPFDWRPEIGDWVRLTPNGVHHAANWEGAVVGVDHQIPGGDAEPYTMLDIAGSFGGRVSRWITLRERTRLRETIDETVNPPAPPPGAGNTVALYLTTAAGEAGFSSPSTPGASLGGYVSTTPASSGLFRAVTASEGDDGITLYRTIAIVNSSYEETHEGLRVWVNTEPEVVALAIALDPEGVVDLEQAGKQGGESADEETAPTPLSGSITYSAPTEIGSGLSIGTLPPRSAVLLHERVVVSSSTAFADTTASVRVAVCLPSEAES